MILRICTIPSIRMAHIDMLYSKTSIRNLSLKILIQILSLIIKRRELNFDNNFEYPFNHSVASFQDHI